MCSPWLRPLSCMLALLTVVSVAQAEDLHVKKNISVGGNVVSSSETSLKGARSRDVNQSPAGAMVMWNNRMLKITGPSSVKAKGVSRFSNSARPPTISMTKTTAMKCD